MDEFKEPTEAKTIGSLLSEEVKTIKLAIDNTPRQGLSTSAPTGRRLQTLSEQELRKPDADQLGIRDDEAGLVALAELVKNTVLSSPLYGQNQSEVTLAIFNMIVDLLGDETAETILSAFKICVRRNNKLPTVADINNTIRPPKERLSGSLYADYTSRRSNGEYLGLEEQEFCRAYERQEWNKV